jgi:hypothetical protein
MSKLRDLWQTLYGCDDLYKGLLVDPTKIFESHTPINISGLHMGTESTRGYTYRIYPNSLLYHVSLPNGRRRLIGALSQF